MAKIKLENGREVETSTMSKTELFKNWQTRDNWITDHKESEDPAKFDRYLDHLPILEAEMTSQGIGFTPRRQAGSTPSPTPRASNASAVNVPEIPKTVKRADELLVTAKADQTAAEHDRDQAEDNLTSLQTLAGTQKDINDTSDDLAEENAAISKLEAINGRRTTIVGRFFNKAKRKQHQLDKAFVKTLNGNSNGDIDFSKKSINAAVEGLKVQAAQHQTKLNNLNAKKTVQVDALKTAGITGPLGTIDQINAATQIANDTLDNAKKHLSKIDDRIEFLEDRKEELEANQPGFFGRSLLPLGIGAGTTAGLLAATFLTPVAVLGGLAAAGTVAVLGLSNLNLPFRAIAGGLAAVAAATFSPQLADTSLVQSYLDVNSVSGVNTAGITGYLADLSDSITGFFGSPVEASEATTIAEADPVVADGHGEELAAATDVALAELGGNDTADINVADAGAQSGVGSGAAYNPETVDAAVASVEESVTALQKVTEEFRNSAAFSLDDSNYVPSIDPNGPLGETARVFEEATANLSALAPISADGVADINTVSEAVEVASVAPEAGDMPSSQSSPDYTSEPDSYLDDIGGSYTPPAVVAAAGELPSVDPTVPLNLEAVAISLKELLNGAASDDLGAIVQISEIAGDRLDPSFMQIIAEQADASTHSDFIDSVSSAAAIQAFLDNPNSIGDVFKILAEGVTEKVPGTINDTYVPEDKVNALLMKLDNM